jgi:signal transduction histidine kinase/DNA-binding response OmpR family regulator
VNEISCRVLDAFFIALREQGISFQSLVDGVPYTIEHLRNKGERIDWDAFVRFLANASTIWNERELLWMGGRFLRSPFIRPLALVARTLFSAKDYYRWAYTPRKGFGVQLMSCVEPSYEEISHDTLRLSIRIQEGYALPPKAFFTLGQGTLMEMTRIVGLGPADAKMVEIPRGAQFIVKIPSRPRLLVRLQRYARTPFTLRAAGRELKEATENLQMRYEQLERAHALLDRQTTALRTAHAINGIVQAELELAPAMETVVKAMVEIGGFRGAVQHVDATVGGRHTHLKASYGDTPVDITPMRVPIHVGDRLFGEMHLWTRDGQTDGYDELIRYITPAISMAVDDALKYTALLDIQGTLENRVIERTEELIRVRDDLTRAIGELRKARAARDRLFANISHEFRTPLTLIKGPVEQLLSGELRGNEKEQYHLIHKNCTRLLQLVGQLLDLSKVESGQMTLHPQEIDLVNVVRDTAAAFEAAAIRHGMSFMVRCPEQPLAGWCDTDCVVKIISNLLSNAIKFTPDGGTVSMTVRGIPSGIEIDVSDTGVGIASDRLSRIFDRFYQVDDSQTRVHGGTGIGLALTKELVELLKGTIEVQSEPGKGSTFTVRLPIDKEHFTANEVGQEYPALHAGLLSGELAMPLPKQQGYAALPDEDDDDGSDETEPLILIVEDDADMRSYLRTTLEHRYRILEAGEGADGFESAIAMVPDLVVSDVMMPTMDGFRLCERLKTDERTSHIPVILLTAKASQESRFEGLETGADDYITKPFDAKELQIRVRNLIEQREKLREKFRREGTFSLKEITITSADERFINRAMAILEAHISDQAFTTEVFAQEMYLSRMQFHRKIRALTDLSPWQFVRKVRLHRAAELLRKRAGNVSDIASRIGYDSPSKFTEAFRREFGKTPSEFGVQPIA